MTMNFLLMSLLAAAAPDAPVAPAPVAPVSPDATTTTPSDREPPVIRDLAVAAASLSAAPVVTAVIEDATGIDRGIIYFRAMPALPSKPYESVTMPGGHTGLFIARLPDGLQRTGFEYYVEVHDSAGNPPTFLGGADHPYFVDPATDDTLARLERAKVSKPQGIGPGWPMAALGVGVLGSAGSAAFFLHYALLQSRGPAIASELNDPSTSADERTLLVKEQKDAPGLMVLDVSAGTVLGVVGLAGLTTGIVLIAVNSAAE
jgi:hypothetical protein